MTKYGERDQEDQINHDYVTELVAHSGRYSKEGTKIFTNPNGEKNKSAGIVNGKMQYPDIVLIKTSIDKPLIIAEIETKKSVNERESEQWRKYASLNVSFYLYVPKESVDDAKRLLSGINIKGLRGYRVTDSGIKIINIF